MSYTYKYPRPSVSVDIMVFLENKTSFNILLIQRKNPPFQNMWALPGGFMDMDETLYEAAVRELKEETNIKNTKLKQFKTYSDPDRDPRGRTVSTIFFTFIDELPGKAKAADDAANLAWFDINKLPDLAFDHSMIINDAKMKLLKK